LILIIPLYYLISFFLHLHISEHLWSFAMILDFEWILLPLWFFVVCCCKRSKLLVIFIMEPPINIFSLICIVYHWILMITLSIFTSIRIKHNRHVALCWSYWFFYCFFFFRYNFLIYVSWYLVLLHFKIFLTYFRFRLTLNDFIMMLKRRWWKNVIR